MPRTPFLTPADSEARMRDCAYELFTALEIMVVQCRGVHTPAAEHARAVAWRVLARASQENPKHHADTTAQMWDALVTARCP